MPRERTEYAWDDEAGAIVDADGAVLAAISPDPIGSLDADTLDRASGGVLVAPCGEHAQTDRPPTKDSLDQWSEDAWDRFTDAFTRSRDAARERGVELVVHPGAGGRLTDAICTRVWLEGFAHDAPPMLADPVGWLTPSMLGDADDHLARFTDAINAWPGVWGVLIRSCAPRGDDSLVPCAVEDGVLDAAMLHAAFDRIDSPRRIERR